MSSVAERLKALNITLPAVATPAAAYVPFVRTGKLVFLSGHIAKRDGKPWVGQLGLTMATDEGQAAARAIAIDLLGTLQAALGDLANVRRIVKVMSLVNSTPTLPSSTWSPTAARNCWSRSSAPPSARMRAARSAWRRFRWAPVSRSN